jgi:hypothetical protein
MPGGGAGGLMMDATAIHTDGAGEISAIAEKAVPVNADLLVIEDSATGWSKKSATLQAVANLGQRYALPVHALTYSPADGATVYFGNMLKAPVATASANKVYIRRPGMITVAEIYSWATTAGTAEAWSLYVRKNSATDYLIATLTVAASERIWSNTALAIAVVAGDYIEIKVVNPAWATNPAAVTFAGYVLIEVP